MRSCCSPWWLSGINGYSHSCWTRLSSGAWPKERELLGQPGVTSSLHQNLLKPSELALHCFWSKREGWAHPGFCSYFPPVKAQQGIHMDNANSSHLKDLGCWKCKWQEVTWILTFPASREMTQFTCCSSKGILLILKDFIKQGVLFISAWILKGSKEWGMSFTAWHIYTN